MEIVETYVDFALEVRQRLGRLTFRDQNMSIEIRDDTIPPFYDWIGWKVIPSRVTDRELDEIENE